MIIVCHVTKICGDKIWAEGGGCQSPRLSLLGWAGLGERGKDDDDKDHSNRQHTSHLTGEREKVLEQKSLGAQSKSEFWRIHNHEEASVFIATNNITITAS